MALDLGKFERRHEFDLETQALGTIKCGTLKVGMLSTVAKIFTDQDSDALALSRKILGMVGEREALPTGDAESQEAALTDEDIQQITDDEVEKFAQGFVAHNDWLLHSYDDDSRQMRTNEKGERVVSYSPKIADFPIRKDERSSQYLIRILRRYFDEQNERLKKMLGSMPSLQPALQASNKLLETYEKLNKSLGGHFASSLFKDSTLESLRKNLTLSDRLQSTVKEYDLTRLARESRELAPEPISLPKFPENPIVETNRQLGQVIENLDGMRGLAVQSAELFRNMNDTALQMQADYIRNSERTGRQARLAIWIAAVSLLVTAIMPSVASYLDEIDTEAAERKNDARTEILKKELQDLGVAQKASAAALVDALRKSNQPQRDDAPKK